MNIRGFFHRYRNVMVVVTAALLLELISAAQFYYTHCQLGDELERHSENELTIKSVIIKGVFRSVENSLNQHLWDIERNLDKPDSMFIVVKRLIEHNPFVTGASIPFTENFYQGKGRLFEPYAWKENGEVRVMQLGNHEGHDHTKHPAWKKVEKERKPFWSEPYEYKVGTELTSLTTYSYPLFDKSDRFIGVCGLDVSLKWVGDTLNVRHAYPSSFDLLLTENGDLISGPTKSIVRWFDAEKVAKIMKKVSVGEMEEGRKSESGRTHILPFVSDVDGAEGSIIYAFMRGDPHWRLVVVCYDDEVYGKQEWMLGLVGLLTLFTFCVLGFIIHRFARSEQKLHDASLEQERLGSELRIARDIQMDMLPKAGLEAGSVRISGWVSAAKEVGGDIYDYLVRDGKLFFCIGDVSGKGIPAAMVMATIHSNFRLISAHEDNPARMMEALNKLSCEGNEKNIFTTFFIGVLDLQDGRLRYCNAGHDTPILEERGERKEERGERREEREYLVGDVRALEVAPNLPLGLFDDFSYQLQETVMGDGEVLFLYTDGLTEGKDRAGRMFGLDRVKRLLGNLPFTTDDLMTPEEILQYMVKAAHDFADGTEQSDDLTMLVVQHLPKSQKGEEHLVLQNNLGELARLKQFVVTVADKVGMEASVAHNVRLALEEVVVNVMEYAYPGQEGEIRVDALFDNRQLTLVVTDSGSPFDPTAAEDADTTLTAEERPIGGLGIFLTRQLMDTVDYERKDGKNVLTMKKLLQ